VKKPIAEEPVAAEPAAATDPDGDVEMQQAPHKPQPPPAAPAPKPHPPAEPPAAAPAAPAAAPVAAADGVAGQLIMKVDKLLEVLLARQGQQPARQPLAPPVPQLPPLHLSQLQPMEVEMEPQPGAGVTEATLRCDLLLLCCPE
jgi:hypothetical protein